MNVTLDFGIGSEIQKIRPCVVIQNDIRNFSSGTVIVAPITHTSKAIPCMAEISPQYNPDGSILVDGYVNLSHIQTVSKSRLGNFIAKLSPADMKKVNYSIYDTTGVMAQIKENERKLNDKLEYIEKLKNERNIAQDDLNTIFELTGSHNVNDVIKYIKKK